LYKNQSDTPEIYNVKGATFYKGKYCFYLKNIFVLNKNCLYHLVCKTEGDVSCKD